MKKPTKYYHGSKNKFKILHKGSYVTPYINDAAIFAVPWDSNELQSTGGSDGRPPKQLEFKTFIPKDHPLYIYELPPNIDIEPAPTNGGKIYTWNKKILSDTSVKIAKIIPSWHRTLLKMAQLHDDTLLSSIENEEEGKEYAHNIFMDIINSLDFDEDLTMD